MWLKRILCLSFFFLTLLQNKDASKQKWCNHPLNTAQRIYTGYETEGHICSEKNPNLNVTSKTLGQLCLDEYNVSSISVVLFLYYILIQTKSNSLLCSHGNNSDVVLIRSSIPQGVWEPHGFVVSDRDGKKCL